MKQKLNKFKLLITFSLAGLLLFACQADKDLTNENLYEKNGVIMHKKFEELIKETQFRTAFEKISKPKKGFSNKGSATSRTVMENQYRFTISDYPANVVVSDSITSYTFLITRENTTPNVFENLIINIKQNQEPSAFILKYESVTSFNDAPFNPNTFQGKRYLNPIEYNPNEYVPNVGKLVSYEVCRTVTSWYCYGPGEHNDHTDCSMGFGIDYEICTLVNYDDGQTGGSSDSSSPGSQHSGGGVVTAPVVPCRVCPEFGDPDTPCGKLKKQLETPVISNALIQLRNSMHISGETAHIFSNNASGQVTATPQTNSSGNSAKLKITSTTFGIAHTHQEGPVGDPSDLFPMFAPMDLIGIAIAINGYNNPIPSETPFFFNMMVVNGATYAVTPNIPNDLGASNVLYDTEKMGDLNDKLEDIFRKIDPNIENHLVDKDKLAKAFLEFMNSTNNPARTNFNVSLYKIDNSDLASKIWSKVELDPTKPNGVKNTPCN